MVSPSPGLGDTRSRWSESWGPQVTPQRWHHPVPDLGDLMSRGGGDTPWSRALGTPCHTGPGLKDCQSHSGGGVPKSWALGIPCYTTQVTSPLETPGHTWTWHPPVLTLETPSHMAEVVSPSPGPWPPQVTPRRWHPPVPPSAGLRPAGRWQPGPGRGCPGWPPRRPPRRSAGCEQAPGCGRRR